MSEPSFPLHWPAGWPRTQFPQHSRFGARGSGVSMTQALDMLEHELRLLGALHPVVSTNVQTRLDGRPYANQAAPKDRGVAVYFTLRKRRVVLACDKWNKPECNLWAVAKHVEALRGQERWGVGSVEQAFAGYTALAEKTQATCWDVLQIVVNAGEAMILKSYRELARRAHPDTGGSEEAMRSLNEARDNALAITRANAEIGRAATVGQQFRRTMG
jgi:hypothetical protein